MISTVSAVLYIEVGLQRVKKSLAARRIGSVRSPANLADNRKETGP